MAEESVNIIRDTNRNQIFLNRRRQKDEETDLRRSLTNLQLNPADVTTIANKLKTKSSMSASELKSLQNALIDNPKNIELVLNTHGALRGLVRELTGHDVSKQIASCCCLCNLALADSKGCCTIAKAAGAYLVTTLDNMTTQLAVTCAWTLGNLSGSGGRASDVIAAQGALSKLCDVTCAGGDLREAAVYALTHLAYQLKDDLTPEHLDKIVQSLSQTELDVDTSYLLFIISCHKCFTSDIIPETYLNKIVEKFTVSMEPHLNVCINACSTKNCDKKCCVTVYLIRALANMNDCNIYNKLLEYFFNNDIVRCDIRRMLEVDEDRSLWWLLGNMMNCCAREKLFMGLL